MFASRLAPLSAMVAIISANWSSVTVLAMRCPIEVGLHVFDYMEQKLNVIDGVLVLACAGIIST